MAGVLLCVFFVLGAMTGFSEPGRHLALRVSRLMRSCAAGALDRTEPARTAVDYLRRNITAAIAEFASMRRPAARRPSLAVPRDRRRRFWSGSAVALVEKAGGFYVLSAAGSLTGPVSPGGQPDLPILSGRPVEDAAGMVLVRDAAILVRAEAELSRPISEMRLETDGTASLFLDRVRIELVIDPDQEALEIRRAAEVLRRWQGREQLVAMLDMTTPGLAVLRLRTPLPPRRTRAVPWQTFSQASSSGRVEAIRIARKDR
jgi:hypothetical protein